MIERPHARGSHFPVWKTACLAVLLLFVSCAAPSEPRVETVQTPPQKLPYSFESLTGVRDGDILRSKAVFSGVPQPLVLEMTFRIGVPTRLESGRYRWTREGQVEEGSMAEVSVTFLGGQSDRPSLGGVFMLQNPSGAAVGRVVLPTTIVSRR